MRCVERQGEVCQSWKSPPPTDRAREPSWEMLSCVTGLRCEPFSISSPAICLILLLPPPSSSSMRLRVGPEGGRAWWISTKLQILCLPSVRDVRTWAPSGEEETQFTLLDVLITSLTFFCVSHAHISRLPKTRSTRPSSPITPQWCILQLLSSSPGIFVASSMSTAIVSPKMLLTTDSTLFLLNLNLGAAGFSSSSSMAAMGSFLSFMLPDLTSER
mmetsp:Transcript_8965/g.20540  ORF Transcript_8965/g.20540 Transcript_8965/m.20540 type:complete len:216 (+) Transcript_8965:2585-3232(+)